MRSLPLRTLAATMIAALLITSVAEAQQREDRRRQRGERGQRGQRESRRFGGQRGGGSNLPSLLRLDEVRKDIQLDETQAELVEVAEDEARGDRSRQRFNFQDASDEEREKYFAERRARAEKEARAAKEMLATILSKEQMTRLTEISIQQKGTGALTTPDVVSQLKITAEQKEKIEKAQQASADEVRSKMRELFRGGNRGGSGDGNFDEMRKKMTALRADADKKILAVLTAEQQSQFEVMKGKKIDLPQRGFGRRDGFGRGGRQGRRGGGNRPRRPQRPDSET